MPTRGNDDNIQKTMIEGVLECRIPQDPLPVIFDSPHSGSHYPDDFNAACSMDDLRQIEDTYVCDLFNEATQLGAPFLRALFARSYIDANRREDDIDPLLIDGTWPKDLYGALKPTNRSDAGIGLIPRLIKPGQAIYDAPLSPQTIKRRIDVYYTPYHEQLGTLLESATYYYGGFWHINCHSMPSSSAYPKRSFKLSGAKPQPSDIVLSDQDGRTCSKDFMHALRSFWEDKGFAVSVNDPFKGAEIISRHAQPTRRKNAVQIEINRSLYMNEETREKSKDFEVIKGHCTDMIRFCTEYAQSHLPRLAAD